MKKLIFILGMLATLVGSAQQPQKLPMGVIIRDPADRNYTVQQGEDLVDSLNVLWGELCGVEFYYNGENQATGHGSSTYFDHNIVVAPQNLSANGRYIEGRILIDRDNFLYAISNNVLNGHHTQERWIYHEMGHAFGLKHSFGSSPDIFDPSKIGYVDSRDAFINGDGLFDTQPHGSGYLSCLSVASDGNGNCTYSSNGCLDLDGIPYVAGAEYGNLMNYPLSDCSTERADIELTPSQIRRMRNTVQLYNYSGGYQFPSGRRYHFFLYDEFGNITNNIYNKVTSENIGFASYAETGSVAVAIFNPSTGVYDINLDITFTDTDYALPDLHIRLIEKDDTGTPLDTFYHTMYDVVVQKGTGTDITDWQGVYFTGHGTEVFGDPSDAGRQIFQEVDFSFTPETVYVTPAIDKFEYFTMISNGVILTNTQVSFKYYHRLNGSEHLRVYGYKPDGSIKLLKFKSYSEGGINDYPSNYSEFQTLVFDISDTDTITNLQIRNYSGSPLYVTECGVVDEGGRSISTTYFSISHEGIRSAAGYGILDLAENTTNPVFVDFERPKGNLITEEITDTKSIPVFYDEPTSFIIRCPANGFSQEFKAFPFPFCPDEDDPLSEGLKHGAAEIVPCYTRTHYER